jgi:ubiquitin C-terminal hydrolase
MSHNNVNGGFMNAFNNGNLFDLYIKKEEDEKTQDIKKKNKINKPHYPTKNAMTSYEYHNIQTYNQQQQPLQQINVNIIINNIAQNFKNSKPIINAFFAKLRKQAGGNIKYYSVGGAIEKDTDLERLAQINIEIESINRQMINMTDAVIPGGDNGQLEIRFLDLIDRLEKLNEETTKIIKKVQNIEQKTKEDIDLTQSDIQNLLDGTKEHRVRQRRNFEEVERRDFEERQRQATEEQQRKAVEEQHRKAAEERQRQAAEERQRQAAEERQKQAVEEQQRKATEEQHRKAAEERQKQAAEEQQRKADAERQRQATEEQQRKADAERQRQATEEQQRKADAERQRKATEEQQRKAAEERQKQAAEERQKQAAEERQKQAAEERQKQAAEERQRQATEEQHRKAAEERQRQAVEEQQRKAAEERQRQRQAVEAERQKLQKETECTKFKFGDKVVVDKIITHDEFKIKYLGRSGTILDHKSWNEQYKCCSYNVLFDYGKKYLLEFYEDEIRLINDEEAEMLKKEDEENSVIMDIKKQLERKLQGRFDHMMKDDKNKINVNEFIMIVNSNIDKFDKIDESKLKCIFNFLQKDDHINKVYEIIFLGMAIPSLNELRLDSPAIIDNMKNIILNQNTKQSIAEILSILKFSDTSEHEDAQEFLSGIIDKLNLDIFSFYFYTKKWCNDIKTPNKNDIHQIVRNKPDNISLTTSKILGLEVKIKGNTSISDLIKKYIDYNINEDKEGFSSKCRELNSSSQIEKIDIICPSNYLLIQLKCYNKQKEKINYNINDSGLSDEITIYDNEYELIGITSHSGNLNLGHYVSYIKYGNDWMEYNDSSVNSVTKSISYTKKLPYILLYKLKSYNDKGKYKENPGEGQNGIINLGATCYCNASLQLLFRTDLYSVINQQAAETMTNENLRKAYILRKIIEENINKYSKELQIMLNYNEDNDFFNTADKILSNFIELKNLTILTDKDKENIEKIMNTFRMLYPEKGLINQETFAKKNYGDSIKKLLAKGTTIMEGGKLYKQKYIKYSEKLNKNH